MRTLHHTYFHTPPRQSHTECATPPAHSVQKYSSPHTAPSMIIVIPFSIHHQYPPVQIQMSNQQPHVPYLPSSFFTPIHNQSLALRPQLHLNCLRDHGPPDFRTTWHHLLRFRNKSAFCNLQATIFPAIVVSTTNCNTADNTAPFWWLLLHPNMLIFLRPPLTNNKTTPPSKNPYVIALTQLSLAILLTSSTLQCRSNA